MVVVVTSYDVKALLGINAHGYYAVARLRH